MASLHFVLPDRDVIQRASGVNDPYSIRNYYGHGPIAFAKRRRFQRALNLASRIPAGRVIDMGTGDGVLLPTLSRTFEQVLGADINRTHIEQSKRLVAALSLDNVELVCLEDCSFEQLRREKGVTFDLLFLLETLEHVGSQPDMWTGKIRFLRDCFSLLRPEGRIIITVPKMVGLVMLAKNLIQRCLGMGYDSMTFRQLLRSSFLKDTTELEPQWRGGHVGFNHLKLDRYLREQFVMHHRSESLISVFYVIGQPVDVVSD